MGDADGVLVLALMRRLLADGSAKQLRVDAHLSLADVARAVGTAPSTIWRYENLVERMPRGEVAMRYARFLAQLADLQLSAVG